MAQILLTIYQGNTQDPFLITAQKSTGAATDLTGATLSVVFNGAGGARFVGSGTPTTTDAPNGKFTYQQSAADVATPGDYELSFTSTKAGATRTYLPIGLRILPTP